MGETTAYIIDIEAFVFLKSVTDRIPRGLSLSRCKFDKTSLQCGEIGNATIVSQFEPKSLHTDELTSGEKVTCIAGCIKYRDARNIIRRMGFARYCTGEVGYFTFSPIDDEEYEYSY